MTRRPLIRPAAVALTMIACLLAIPASVGAVTPTANSGGAWIKDQLVGYSWRVGDEPPDWMAAAINHAADRSTATREARAARFVYDPAAVSTIAYTTKMARGAIGWTPYKNPPNDFRVKLRKQGYVLDDVGPLDWCQFHAAPTPGCFDAEMIALHEFGHVQGLGHMKRSAYPLSSWTDSVMHGYPPGVRSNPREGWDQDFFGPCDVARLQLKYGLISEDARYSTCLRLKTRLDLNTRLADGGPPGSRLFTATLKIAGKEKSAAAGDLLDGRRVMLQRKGPNSSRWVDVAQMMPLNDGTGRYRATAVPEPGEKWRARFRKPGGEGLRPSSSDAYPKQNDDDDDDDEEGPPPPGNLDRLQPGNS